MIVLNKKTGEDVSSDYLRLMNGEITRQEFADIAGIENTPVLYTTEYCDVNTGKTRKINYADLFWT